MKNLKYALMGLSLAAMVVACDDQGEELTSFEYAREFAPIGLKASVRNQTDVRLEWTAAAANNYTLNVYHLEEDSISETFMTTIAGITNDDIPYTVTGILEGEETYRFELQTIDTDNESRNSKLSSVEATTGTESILLEPAESEIAWNSVVLRFSALVAAGDLLTLTSDEGAVIKHSVTSDESAAYAATIGDLTAETTYKAVLTHQGISKVKTRGTTTFTTPMNLEGATLISSAEDLYDAIKNAEDGAILALDSMTFVVPSKSEAEGYIAGPTKLDIRKNITIKSARRANRAIINGNFHIYDGASLTLQQVVVDGTGINDQIFAIKAEAAEAGLVTLEDCEIIGDASQTKGLIYNTTANVAAGLVVNNSIIHGILCNGGDFIDARGNGGTYREITITNSTFYDCFQKRDFIRMDANDATAVAPVITVTNNTFYNCGNGEANYRMFYVRQADNTITFQKNIMEGFNNKRGFSNNSATAIPVFGSNYYYNCLNLVSASESADATIKAFDSEGTELSASPFKDAANGDFTIVNEDVFYAGVGDPRWTK